MKITPYIRQLIAHWSMALAAIKALPGSIRDGFNEMHWVREIAYVEGPTCIQYAVEPRSHKEWWPMSRASDQAKEPDKEDAPVKLSDARKRKAQP